MAAVSVSLALSACPYDGDNDDWRATEDDAGSTASGSSSSTTGSTSSGANSFTCDQFVFGDQACDSCAHSNCCNEIEACINDAGCLTYIDCSWACAQAADNIECLNECGSNAVVPLINGMNGCFNLKCDDREGGPLTFNNIVKQ